MRHALEVRWRRDTIGAPPRKVTLVQTPALRGTSATLALGATAADGTTSFWSSVNRRWRSGPINVE